MDRTNADRENAPETQGGSAGESSQGSEPAGAGTAPRVGFCQDCGRPLTALTARKVGGGVFCEPCLMARIAAGSPTGAWRTVSPNPFAAAVADAARGDEPRPMLAGILGLIPGVGAMYNGQFAKGMAHLAIFVMLTFVADNVSDFFGIFCAGWIFYMAFEAYHTAVARRDGLPLPNAFGFNDLGERMGFGGSWAGTPPAAGVRPQSAPSGAASPTPQAGFQAETAGAPYGGSGWAGPGTSATAGASAGPGVAAMPGYEPMPGTSAGSGAPAGSGTPYAGVNAAAVGAAPAWTGYVAPTAFAASGSAGPGFAGAGRVAPPASAASPAGRPIGQGAGAWGQTPYTETFTGAGQGYGAGGAGYGASTAPAAGRRFPVGALWLIGLGVLILAVNLLQDWRLTEWWAPLFFAGLSIWVFFRRLRPGGAVLRMMRGPIVLMVVAVVLALHAANLAISDGVAASILLIVLGVVMLLERVLGGWRMTPAAMAGAGAGPGAGVASGVGAAGTGAAWRGDGGVAAPGWNAASAGPAGSVDASDAPARAEWAKAEDRAQPSDLADSAKGSGDAPGEGQDAAEEPGGGWPEGQGPR